MSRAIALITTLLLAIGGLAVAQANPAGTSQYPPTNPQGAPGAYTNQYPTPAQAPVYGTVPQAAPHPAYQRGLQDGFADGQNDRASNHEARPTKTDRFGDAPGYDRSYGDHNMYKQIYRDGYIAGYQQGYNGTAGAYGQPVYVAPAPQAYPVVVGLPPQYANNPAATRGFQDGMTDGQRDRQANNGFQPTKSEDYEDTPGYDKAFGDKDLYRRTYRDAYMAGYQQAYNGVAYQPPAVAYGQPVYIPPQYANTPNSAAYQKGLQDGMHDGLHDRREHHDYRPTKTEHYDDVPGYDKSYGDKETYKHAYRDGYVTGYQQGFNAH